MSWLLGERIVFKDSNLFSTYQKNRFFGLSYQESIQEGKCFCPACLNLTEVPQKCQENYSTYDNLQSEITQKILLP